ncbi:hypothetical protein BOX15_Mlig027511g1, partial [Macrostomum lignano]
NIFLAVLLLLNLLGNGCQGSRLASVASNRSNEKLLIEELISRYREKGLLGRPVKEYDNLVQIKFGLAFVQILDLDENKQLLRTNCWLRYQWRDHHLNWRNWSHPLFKNLTQIRVFPDLIWTPDIQLLNFADERLSERREARIVVYEDGSVLWVPQSLFKSTCPVEILHFPFDTQLCQLEFGSWTYDMTQMNITWYDYEITYDNNTQGLEPNPYIDYTNYIRSQEWRTDGEDEPGIWPSRRRLQIRSVVRCRTVTFQSADGKQYNRTYKTLRYRVLMRRSASFYLSILVLPCILLSCLTWVIFWLPPESPAKMQLGMNIFVAFFILMLLLAETTPSAVKNFPLIGYYYCLNMIMITLSTFLAVIVVNLHFGADRRAPLSPFVRQLVIEGIGRLYMVRQSIPLASHKPPPQQQLLSSQPQNQQHGSLATSPAQPHQPKLHMPQLKYNKFDSRRPSNAAEDSPILAGGHAGAVEKDVREVKRCLRMYLSRLKEKERKNVLAMEWRTFALILDRVFFSAYVMAILIAVISLIPRAHPKLEYSNEDQEFCR